MHAQLSGKRTPRSAICIARSFVRCMFLPRRRLLKVTLRQLRFLGRWPAPAGFDIQLEDLEFNSRHGRPRIEGQSIGRIMVPEVARN